ncbi:uncharacterized protein [Amphiura filiformis]|uniref:uncharacterized protein isoform X2 n=1 Tax=Amphiura filiformis TaxID=82378 RepID=UPI003B211443
MWTRSFQTSDSDDTSLAVDGFQWGLVSKNSPRTKRWARGELVIEGFEWSVASKRVPRGSPPTVTLNVTAILSDNDAYVSGKKLWRLGLFASEWNDGWGVRKNEVRQLLTPKQRKQTARGGVPLTFQNVEGAFDYTEIGCDNYRFLCFELAKHGKAKPDFNMRMYTMQDTLIGCDEVPCQQAGQNQINDDGSPSCLQSCAYDYSPVCGSNGHTYPNKCEIQNEIRCFPNVSLEVVFEDDCNKSVAVTSVFWGVEAVNYVTRGPSDLLIDAIVFTEGPNDVMGTDLWRMGLFGSKYANGSGPRLDYQHQILNSTYASKPLFTWKPISLGFLVGVQFDVGKIGCSIYKFFCLEFAKGDNPTPDFNFRSLNGPATFIACRTAPCNGPEDDGTGRDIASFERFRWTLSGHGMAIPGEPMNVTLTVTVPVLRNSDEIRGTNLWRIGIYGSGSEDGSDPERYSYVRQTITDEQVATSVVPGSDMVLSIDTQFAITGVGCGDYGYFCVEFAKADNPVPDFIFNQDGNGQPIVVCQQIACRDGDSATESASSIARLKSLNWNLEVTHLIIGYPSNVTLQVTILPNDQTDTIIGEGLWRLGIFFSKTPNVQGARHKYDPQILPEEYADWPLVPRLPLLFLDVTTLIDVTGIGCNMWRYVCVEFAKGANAVPDFELPLPGGITAAVSCREFPCTSGHSSRGLTASIDHFTWSISGSPGSTNPGELEDVTLAITVPVSHTSDEIRGSNLWRIGLYGSDRINGEGGDRFYYIRQILTDQQVSTPLIPDTDIEFNIETQYMLSGVGCGKFRHLCVEIARGDFPQPEYVFNEEQGGEPIVVCQQMTCTGGSPPGTNPNHGQGQENTNPNHGQDIGRTENERRLVARPSSLNWNVWVTDLNYGRPSNVTLRIHIVPHDSTDVIEGIGLWRIGLFFSAEVDGQGKRHKYHRQVLPTEYADWPLGPRSILEFRDFNTPIDVTGLGCETWPYVCLEFAKGDNAMPDFDLPLPGGLDAAVACRTFPCISNMPTPAGPPAPAGGDINGEGGARDPDYPALPGEASPSIPSAAVTTIRISNFEATADRVRFLLAVTPGGYSQRIQGEGLWRIGLYGSSDRNGEEIGSPHKRQVLNVVSQGKSLRPQSQLVFDIDTRFQMYELGCSELRYICIEFGKGDNPIPDFNLVLPGSDTVVTCQMVPCNTPNPQPFNPNTNNNNQPGPALPNNNNGGGGGGLGHIAQLTGLFWTMQPIIIRNDARSLIRLRVTAPISNNSDTINGRGLWRVSLFGAPDSIGSEPHFDYHHQILRQEDQNEAAAPYFNLSFNAITDFDLMGIGCVQYLYLCIEFGKGDNPVPDFYLPLNGGESSIVSCQRAKCLNPNAMPLDTTNEPQIQGTAQLARFGWEMNPLRKNPDGPSDVSFTLTITPNPSTDVISGDGLWRVGVFGSQRENGDEPRESYKRQVLNQLQANQALSESPLVFDVQTTIDMREMGCGAFKFLCIEFSKGDEPAPDFRMPLNGRDSLISCQNVPCLNTNRQRPRPRPNSRPRPPPPPQKRPNRGNQDTRPDSNPSTKKPPQPVTEEQSIVTTAISNRPTLSPYFHLWPTMSPPEPTRQLRPQQPETKPKPRPRPPYNRPQTTPSDQSTWSINTNPNKVGTNEDNNNGNNVFKPDNTHTQERPEPPYNRQPQPQPEPNPRVQPHIQETNPETERQRYVPIPGRKVVWFAAIRWKASVEKVYPDGSQEVNLDVMLLPHNNRVNAVMGRGLWRMGIFGSTNIDGHGPKHDYKQQILGPFEQGNPLIPPNFLQFDIDTEFDIKSVGCGKFKYVCLEFAKGARPSLDFDLVVEDGVLGPIISCQAAPCDSFTTFLTTRGPPSAQRPYVIIQHVRPEEVHITEEAQNQLDIDIEIVYNRRSDEVTGTNLWRLELWSSPKPDGSGTRLVSLDQALTDAQMGKALVRPYPFEFTNVRMNLDMRGNRCSYARYICARLTNEPFRHLEPEFDLTGEPNYRALTGCTKTKCLRTEAVAAHPNTRPLVKFSGVTVGIPTIEENRLNKLALRVSIQVSSQSDAVSGSQLWQLNVWGSKKANGQGRRYSNLEQALTPQQADMSVVAATDLLFEYVRFDLDMSSARCNDISYICVKISTASTNFDLQGMPNKDALKECTTVTCETASVPEFYVNSVSIILPPTPVISGETNPMTMDFEIVYDVSNSDAIRGNGVWRVKIWGSDKAGGGGPRISQAPNALTSQQGSQPLILGRPFTIRGIEYSMDLTNYYCRDVSFVCAQLVEGNNSFNIRPVPNKRSLVSCQRIHCING